VRKSTITFIILSAVASFFNYAIYPALSRVLDANQFVDITVALAVFTQLSSFMLSIVALTIGLSKEEGAKDTKDIVEKLQAILAHMFVVIVAVFLLTSPYLLEKLKLPFGLLLPICVMLGLSVVMSIISGYLNGKKKLVKLGLALSFSAILQFVFSIGFALTTKSGFATLNGMALAAFLAIVLTYQFCKSEKLPRVSSIFLHRVTFYKSPEVRALVKYTILSSIASLIINILLILDLLIVNSRQVDAKLYADMYVISRIVFFGGMLFVWPFLSNIDVKNLKNNNGLFVRLMGLFTVIVVGAMGGMLLFGQQVIQILLGSSYGSSSSITSLALLAILYKGMFLAITTFVLYFMVLRSYWAVSLPVILSLLTVLFMTLYGRHASTLGIVTGLNFIGIVGVLIGLCGFIKLGSTRKSTINS
jgi:O-antigen/teichoic acid export membrane protein